MTKENRPHEEGGTRSGGPARILPVDPVIAPWLARQPCECREAQLLRMIASGELPLPMSGSFKTLAGVVRAAAIRKLRQVSHDIAGPPYAGRDTNDERDHWHRVANRPSDAELQCRRDVYDRPPRTPAQVQAEVRHSWARFERGAS